MTQQLYRIVPHHTTASQICLFKNRAIFNNFQRIYVLAAAVSAPVIVKLGEF